MNKDKLNFTIPLSISKGLVNADADIVGKENTDFDVDSMYVEGVAATPKLDLDKQILQPKGFILDYFLKNGFVNYNHQSSMSPDAIIGEPVNVEIKDNKFFIKVKLYSWSNLAKSVYEIAKNLDKDKSTDRTLGFSIEGLALETTKEGVVKSLLVTGCAICFVPKNNDTYLKIVKGININNLDNFRQDYKFKPVYSEVEEGVKKDYILNLNVGDKQILVDTKLQFHYRDNPILKVKSLEDIQKAIIVIAEGYKDGFIKEDKKEELLKVIKNKKLELKNN